MAKFRFRFEPLLTLRKQTRDERRGHLAEAFAAQNKLEARRDALNEELDQQKDHWRTGASPGRLDVDRLMWANRYDAVLRAELAVIAGHEKTLAVEVERRREALVAAEREVRVLEKLREKQHEAFRQQQATAEMKFFDEVASRRSPIQEVA